MFKASSPSSSLGPGSPECSAPGPSFAQVKEFGVCKQFV